MPARHLTSWTAGNVIPRDRIDFSRYLAANFPVRMRQKPSDDNALGVVKFMFPKPGSIYLRDTPTKHLFQQSRAYSHGCIRIGKPLDLAHELLSQQLEDRRRCSAKALRPRGEDLSEPARRCRCIWSISPLSRSGAGSRYADIYGRDALVRAALRKAGLESGAADE